MSVTVPVVVPFNNTFPPSAVWSGPAFPFCAVLESFPPCHIHALCGKAPVFCEGTMRQAFGSLQAPAQNNGVYVQGSSQGSRQVPAYTRLYSLKNRHIADSP